MASELCKVCGERQAAPGGEVCRSCVELALRGYGWTSGPPATRLEDVRRGPGDQGALDELAERAKARREAEREPDE
jgi:hypothetical protein